MQVLKQFDLTGKTAVVTGCDTGLGQGMSIALAEAGADIIGISVVGDTTDTKNSIEAAGRTFTHYRVDISDREQLYSFINKVVEGSKVDILVNNAGIIMRKPAAEHPDEYWDKVIGINQDAQFIMGREFGRRMINNGGGKIIFTCSFLSFQGRINVPGYTASKSAVARLIRAFGSEWGSKGVSVNGIAPGYIATNSTHALRYERERSKSLLERIPVGRWGVPDDFKGPVVFLASSASDYVNGAVLFVDGGWMAR